VSLELGGHVTATFESSNLVVLSPGVPNDLPEIARARAAGVTVIGELELASRWLRGPIVAITGTKGKSTTTTLVGRMLEAAGKRVLVGGNIGHPVSAQVDASTADTVHVIEASSFQLETTDTFRPWIAALLNFSPDHLDRHPDQASYGAAKLRIFANQGSQDWAVVNADSPEAIEMTQNVRARVMTFGVEQPADVHVGRGFVWQRTSEGDIPLLPVAASQLQGRHMLSNVAAATAISHLAGASGASLAKALEGFHGLEHVMELVATRGGVRFVNDSKATNIDAAAKSIESFDKVVAIIGGKFKGGNLADLAEPLRVHGRAVVAIGEARPMVSAALKHVVPLVEADSLADAVRRAWDLAVPDGVVLLAPACSSFDMFADYAERGRKFKEEVRKLITEV
jgi:UDP-N-acetylmuramoylalanine--D-glutamate ligase